MAADHINEFQNVIASLVVSDAAGAIALYEKAFGARELSRSADGQGKIMHACLQIGNSKLFVSDMNPKMGTDTPSVSTFYLYIPNVDTTFEQAVKAGCEELFPVRDMFWGDRTGAVTDRFGNRWTLATHMRDVSPEEMEAARKKWVENA